jgi:DNA-directed RNA polymerase subunit RPC12/RpoP
MKPDYIDILKNTTKLPVWYDENGAPRYEPFKPELCSNPAADEIMLIEIECQECSHRFIVECTYSRYHFLVKRPMMVPLKPFSELIGNNPKYVPCYGDPPFHGQDQAGYIKENCRGGSTMSSRNIRAVGLWKRVQYKWVKIHIPQ